MFTTTFDVERDATAPAVTVNAPSRIYSSTIPVSWTVAELGSGATGVYTVSVMTDTGPLQPWLNSVTYTSANFPGEFGHKYTFVVTTTDNVGNVSQAQAETFALRVTKYYYIGSSRVAMRQGDAVTYLHTDHLGTVSVATNQSQAVLARTLNLPYGGVRWSSGTMPTDWGYTGQKEPIGTGLVYLHARFYAPFAGRFVSADTIVPKAADPQAWNRYSYTRNNPVGYIDPSGHRLCEFDASCNPPPTLRQTLQSIGPSNRFVQPLGKMIRSGFDYGYKRNGSFHPGVDYSGAGNPSIRASANGVVIVSDACTRANCVGLYDQAGAFDPDVNGGYGNVMIVEYPYNSLPAAVQAELKVHEGESLYMLYAHLMDAPSLRSGDTVKAGQLIGHAGNTGNSSGAHLHFESRIGKTGSLLYGDMATTTFAPTDKDPYPRFTQWYGSGDFRAFDPESIYYYTARELRFIQP